MFPTRETPWLPYPRGMNIHPKQDPLSGTTAGMNATESTQRRHAFKRKNMGSAPNQRSCQPQTPWPTKYTGRHTHNTVVMGAWHMTATLLR
jgi:hypothetical protein